MENNLSSLRAFPAFEGLAEAQLEAVAAHLEPVTMAPGDVLFRQGASDDSVYLVRSGRVEISLDVPGPDRTLATLEPGAIFGEISLLLRQPRTAAAIAVGPVELWRISREVFGAALDRGERWAVRFLMTTAQVLARRLTTLDEELAALIAETRKAEQTTPVTRVAEMEELRKRLFTEWSF